MIQIPISQRISRPTSLQIREARELAQLTQSEAAMLVSPANSAPYRTWQGYEVDEGSKEHRDIPLSTWELFLLLTGQHPSLKLIVKKK